jgi:hypothetical protein
VVRDRACCDCGYLNESRAALCGNCGGPLRPRRAGTPVLPTTLPEEIGLAALRRSDSEPTCGSGITRSLLTAIVPELPLCSTDGGSVL